MTLPKEPKPRTKQPRNLNENTRKAKNAKISASRKKTHERRQHQTCKTYDIKIQSNKLNKAQKEALTRIFLEAKWLRNDALANGIDEYPLDGTVQVKLPDGTFQTREILTLGSQMQQSTINDLKRDRKALAAKKKKGYKTGKLKFTSQVKSVELKQYGTTYAFKRTKNSKKLTLVRVQNVPGRLRVNGLDQIPDSAEFACAHLVDRPDGYHLLVTCYFDEDDEAVRDCFVPGTVIGIDMGVRTSVTMSDGRKVSAVIGETDRLKHLQRGLSRQVKGSNNYKRTCRLLRREYERLSCRRDDVANKIVHDLLLNEVVFMQDENLRAWVSRGSRARGSRRVHDGVLGRVKARLVGDSRVVVLGRFVPSSRVCPVCGERSHLGLGDRVFVCERCGFSFDRDVNAACNMVRLGCVGLLGLCDDDGVPLVELKSVGARVSCSGLVVRSVDGRLLRVEDVSVLSNDALVGCSASSVR